MKIAAVVVWFFKDKIQNDSVQIKNISTYSGHVGKIYIVDNSSIDNSDIASQISNSVYISNKNENGIAGALNRGCSAAKKDGFEWVLTMDQDSFFDEPQLLEYLKISEEHSKDEDCVSFSIPYFTENRVYPLVKQIQFKILSPLKRKLLHITDLPPAGTEKPKIKYEARNCTWEVITSANIVKLDAWEKIGGYDELLFIDLVDVDFTYRLHLAGYRIIKFLWVYFHHNLGEPKCTLFGKRTPMESDFRMRYIFRNLLILRERYPELDCIPLYLKRYFMDYCLMNVKSFKYLKIFKQSKKEFKDIKNSGKL